MNIPYLNGASLMPRLLLISVVSMVLVVTGCSEAPLSVPKKLDFERSPQADSPSLLGQERLQKRYTESNTPKLPSSKQAAEKNTENAVPEVDQKSAMIVSFDQLPLPTFIQAVYGNILKANYSMDAAVAARTDLVTFHTAKPQTAAQMGNLTRLLLKSYGVAVQDFGGVIRIVPDTASNSYAPQIRRGRAQPTTPTGFRPIFYYVEMDAIRVADFSTLIRSMFGNKLTMQDDLTRNAVLIGGQSDDVAAAMDVIQVFDQPLMRGQHTKVVDPVFWTAEEFSKRMVEVLGGEGYSASISIASGTPIVVLPIQPLNRIVIFASSDAVLDHILHWARELDKPAASQAGGAFFTYPVKYADAQALAKTLSELMSGSSASLAPAAAGTAGTTPTAVAANAIKAGSKIVVNNATNSLIIQGGGPEQYRQWITLLSELDKPTKSAMIDVLVAELDVTTAQSLGVEWDFRQQTPSISNGSINPTTSTGQTPGFNFNIFNNSGLLRTAINAVATTSNNRVLSSPKIMARNGETATISVGTDVPILTQQTTNAAGSNGIPGVTTNSVTYRSTGVILKVRPVINSGNRIDLDISQEVSIVSPTNGGASGTPSIDTKRVDTKLTLKDGSTVMLAGLIANNDGISDGGVPLLKDIPLLGNLFKTQTNSRGKTELVILITPYIINDDFEAEAISDAFQNSLGDWAKELKAQAGVNRSSPASQPGPETHDERLKPFNDNQKASAPAHAIDEEKGHMPTEDKPGIPSAPTSPESDESAPPGVIMSKPQVTTPQNTSDKKAQDKPISPPANSKPVSDPNLLDELRRTINGN